MPKDLFLENIFSSLKEVDNCKVFKKGQYLISQGEIENNIYFIEIGAVRGFYVSEFEELTIRFGYPGSIINALPSFLSGLPSELYIEAIRKTNVKIISKNEFKEIINEGQVSMQQYIELLENMLFQQMEREIDLLTVSPVERLNRVLKRSPHLFQEIPLKYIASYLRMTPETLSRIRNS